MAQDIKSVGCEVKFREELFLPFSLKPAADLSSRDFPPTGNGCSAQSCKYCFNSKSN
jgi:hypothetical protein